MTMKTIKVAKATELQLDWLVAKCEGLPLRLDPMGFKADAPGSREAGWWVWLAQPGSMLVGPGGDTVGRRFYSPSTNWSQGGPIIEREGISIYRMTSDWSAAYNPSGATQDGPTPLIAVMRCYVSSCLGSEIEVPEELL